VKICKIKLCFYFEFILCFIENIDAYFILRAGLRLKANGDVIRCNTDDAMRVT